MTAAKAANDARGPVLGNSSISYSLAFHTGRSVVELPWEPLTRVLRYASIHHASFLLVQTGDHPNLEALAEHPVTTDQLEPLAHVESAGGGAPVHAVLYRIRYPARPAHPWG
jgi:hypothetical protein